MATEEASRKQKEDGVKAVDQAMAILSEHWDCVAIMVSSYNMDGDKQTTFHSETSGNIFAIKAQVNEWIYSNDMVNLSEQDEEDDDDD